MTNENFRDYIDQALIVSLNDDIYQSLNGIVQDYVGEFSRKSCEDCLYDILGYESNDNLRKYVEDKLKQQNVDFAVPDTLIHSLSTISLKYLGEQESGMSGSEREIYSLTIRNMILPHNYKRIPNYLVDTINSLLQSSEMVRTMNNTLQCDETEFIEKVLIEGEEDLSDSVNDCMEEIVYLCKMAEKTKYKDLEIQLACTKDKKDFVFGYNVADELVNTPLWDYVDNNPIETIYHIFPRRAKSLKLRQIKDLFTEVERPDEILTDSSLILHYLLENNNITKDLDDLELTPMELSIYLYYELFLEKKLRNEDGNE